jgi:hypothetical protein
MDEGGLTGDTWCISLEADEDGTREVHSDGELEAAVS